MKSIGKIRQVYAESENMGVYECRGGCLHLQLGRVSLALSREEFLEVATVVAAAREHIALAELPEKGTAH